MASTRTALRSLRPGLLGVTGLALVGTALAGTWSDFKAAFPGLPCQDGWAGCLVDGAPVSPGMVLDAQGRPHPADMRLGFYDFDALPGLSPFTALSAYTGQGVQQAGGAGDADATAEATAEVTVDPAAAAAEQAAAEDAETARQAAAAATQAAQAEAAARAEATARAQAETAARADQERARKEAEAAARAAAAATDSAARAEAQRKADDARKAAEEAARRVEQERVAAEAARKAQEAEARKAQEAAAARAAAEEQARKAADQARVAQEQAAAAEAARKAQEQAAAAEAARKAQEQAAAAAAAVAAAGGPKAGTAAATGGGDAVAMASTPPPEAAGAPASCDNLVALEVPAMMGQLGAGVRSCLEKNLSSAASQTSKDKMSRVLIADAEARRDQGEWERLMKRHLENIDRSDPNLCFKYALHLSRGGASRSSGVIRWADYALENKQQWQGAAYTKNVNGLLKIRAQAANKLWESAEAKLVEDRSDENEAASERYRGQTKDYAREWLDYARASGQDTAAAMALCVSAAGNKEFCGG